MMEEGPHGTYTTGWRCCAKPRGESAFHCATFTLRGTDAGHVVRDGHKYCICPCHEDAPTVTTPSASRAALMADSVKRDGADKAAMKAADVWVLFANSALSSLMVDQPQKTLQEEALVLQASRIADDMLGQFLVRLKVWRE